MTHPTGWPTAQSICDIPEVRAALDAFAQDAHEDNMLAMVSAIMGARVPLTIPAEQPRWSVTVEVAGESILTISDQHCSGKSLAGMDTHCVEKAALNLLGFIGKSPEDMTCPNCNGEGHVHNQVGEYLGECSCVFSLHTRNTIPDADLWKLLPGDGRYLDLPDGGSPSLLTQLQRMVEDARNARIYSPASVRAAALEEADRDPDNCEAYCPRCGGSGEEEAGLDSWGPDAKTVIVNCTHCLGSGLLINAYHALVEQLKEANKRYLDASGKLYFSALSAAPAGGLGEVDAKTVLNSKRYEWLRSCGEQFDHLHILDAQGNIVAEALDTAVDAAIAAAQGEGK